MIINFDNFLNEELFDSKPYDLKLTAVKDGSYAKIYSYEFETDKKFKYLVICPIDKYKRTLDIMFAPKHLNVLSIDDMIGNFETSKIFATLKVILDIHDEEFDTIEAFSEPKRINFYKSLFHRLGYKIIVKDNNVVIAEKPKQLNEGKLTYKLYHLYFFLKYFSKERNEFRKLSRNSKFVKEMTLPLSKLELGHPVGDPFDFKLKKRIEDAKKFYSDEMKIISKKEIEDVFPSVSDIKVIKIPNDKYKVIDGNGRVYVLKQVFKNDIMVDVSLYEPTLHESKSSRFDQIMNIINNTKIGDVLPEDIVYQYVQELHQDDDFIDGDLGDRIERFSKYRLQKIELSYIDLDEFNLSEEIADEFAERYKETGYYPPIVLEYTCRCKIACDCEYLYRIIDGNHRANGLKHIGETYILAFVGLK